MKISLVIPTRNRHKLLKVVAEYAMNSGYPDCEVIVSDNSANDAERALNAQVLARYRDCINFKLVRTPKELSAPDHFEYVMDFASGDYIAYLTDKMVLVPGFLPIVSSVIESTGAEIVNWGYAHYPVCDANDPSGSGRLIMEREFLDGGIEPYDPRMELRQKASGRVLRSRQSTRAYVKGKLVFGCYSKQLVKRIRARSGAVFAGATHDYSAMIQALSLAQKCVIMNRYGILFISLPADLSLGSLTNMNPQAALKYYQAFRSADDVLSALLVPGLYASQHNMVAHDYKKYLKMFGYSHFFDEANWVRAIHYDLTTQVKEWGNPAEMEEQFRLFEEYVQRAGLRIPPARRVLRERLVKLSYDLIKVALGRRGRRLCGAWRTNAVYTASVNEAISRIVTRNSEGEGTRGVSFPLRSE